MCWQTTIRGSDRGSHRAPRMKKIGIIGAGQLGMMLGQAARKLDVECIFLDPADSPPAATVGSVRRFAFDDLDALRDLAADTDVITYEFENVPVAAIEGITSVPVYPPACALRNAQDRLDEKQQFEALGIPVAPYAPVDSQQDLHEAAAAIGLPLVLKTRRFGYDGKGQTVVREAAELDAALAALGGTNLIAEQLIPFEREVSAIGARSVSGEMAVYPLVENRHRNGILDCSLAPADYPALADIGTRYLETMLEHLDYVGTLTIEFFVVNGALMANEYAPRVHNSGHWTIEGAETSQFENHLRAILDLPLGAVTARGSAAMLNLIGSMPPLQDAANPGLSWLHDYGKTPRPGRKLGHITVVAADPDTRQQEIERIRGMLVP
jgi:5-(carboxyamino)imidazole ribonucleotide synthase